MGSKKRSSTDDKEHRAKRTKSPGVRVIGGRIYDSENGKTCHQCRQKTMDFSASCMNKKGEKLCPFKFCHKCLLNRYGEKAEEVALLEHWECPKCRGYCNCSVCMKKKGLKPTGLLAHTAKATGFSSVSEMLLVNGSDRQDVDENTVGKVGSPKKQSSGNEESVMISPRKQGKENSNDNNESNLNLQNSTPKSDVKKSKKARREGLKEICNGNKVDVKCSKKSSPHKSNFVDEISKKRSEANQNNGCLALDKKSSKQKIPKDDASSVSKPNDATEKNSLCHQDVKASGAVKENDKRSLKDVRRTEDKKGKEDITHKDTDISDELKNNKTMTQGSIKCTVNIQNKELDTSVSLPPGSRLTTLADIQLTTEDIGHALQFLEFCAAFGKALNLKKGHAEFVLKDLMRERERERRRCRVHDSLAVRFHILLLSLILKDMDEECAISSPAKDRTSWLRALKKCISESPFKLNDLTPDYFDGDENCYDNLDFSRKLRLLNYLCDEVLSTTELRNWIDEQNSNFVEKQREARGKIAELKDKEKQAKHKLQDELAKALIAKCGIPLSIADHDAIVSQIKRDVDQAHSERLFAIEMAPKRRQRSDAIRTDPIILDADGRAFWKLRGFAGGENILLQDMESWETVTPCEKWSIYEGEQKEEIEKYISALRTKRLRLTKVAQTSLPNGGSEANI